jgi:hypothetical protein
VKGKRSGWEIDLNAWPRIIAAISPLQGLCRLLLYQAWCLFPAAWITREGVPGPAIYERAIRSNPENADYLFALAQIYHDSIWLDEFTFAAGE